MRVRPISFNTLRQLERGMWCIYTGKSWSKHCNNVRKGLLSLAASITSQPTTMTANTRRLMEAQDSIPTSPIQPTCCQQPQLQCKELCPTDALRHVTRNQPLRQAMDDGCLAHTRLPDQHSTAGADTQHNTLAIQHTTGLSVLPQCWTVLTGQIMHSPADKLQDRHVLLPCADWK